MKMSNCKSITLNPCECNENIHFDIDASEDIARKLKINMEFFNLCPGSLQGVDVTIYSNNEPLASSSCIMRVPRNTSNVCKTIVIVFPYENPCEVSKYSVVASCNRID
ncbi:hypothetical protein [Clostridium sp.]|uniref:hypothetical protein n=1 Tax=Clostridium sp. TaxID=1506 RepID=UPI0032180088